MIRPRSSSPVFRAALAGSVLSCLAPLAHAQTTTTRTTRVSSTTRYGVESAVGRERTRRQALAGDADSHLRAGDAAVIRQDYDTAVREYRTAVDSLNDAPATETSRPAAIKKFFDASMTLANQRITEGRYADAESTVKVLLLPQYDPGYAPAIKLLKHLEDPAYFNTTIGPKFVDKVQQVKQLFIEAQGFYDTGRYDSAKRRYEQILNLDPYNSAARHGQERVYLALQKHYENAAYPETRGQMLADVSRGWELPVRKSGVGGNGLRGSKIISDGEGTAALTRKLQSILIPNIEFRSTTVSDAIEFLRQESRRLDPDPDPERRGVNIFLKLPGTGSTVRTAPAATAEPAIPGLPTDAGAPPAAVLTPTATASTRITLTMSRLPLLEALRYVASQAGLKVKVEQYAVSIVPLTEITDALVTATFRVAPNFISNATSGGGGASPGALDQAATSATGSGGGSRDNTGAGTTTIQRQDAKTFLESSGVTFGPGASATYLAASSQLVVRNTQENIDLIEQLVSQQSPIIRQVEIESKFIEITQQNLKELSFDWSLGQANVPGSSKVFFGGGTQGNGRAVTDFPFSDGTGSTLGQAVTNGNRTGTFGISANAIDALLFGGAGAAAAPGIFSVAGVFSDPQFQLLVRALNQQKGVDLLSAPRVTTKSGQKATIEIIREFIYPTQFQPPQIPQTFGGNVTGGGGFLNTLTGVVSGGGSSGGGSFPVTPTTPTNFEKRNTGVTLEVEPVIGPDAYTIDLNLQPQVVDFDGFINYGSPIQTTSTNILGQSQVNIITPNVINQPVFDTRKVSTSVSVYDGSTVVLGGLVREDIQKVNDKVPILGDVPLLGRLFRSKIDQNIKRNLIIFVTAHLIDPSGQLIQSNEEEEEVTAPLNGPDYVAPTRLELIPSKK